MPKPESWLKVTPKGLYCVPGDFHIDPHSGVERAVVTHGHGDHARPGHGAVLATPETLAIASARLGTGARGPERCRRRAFKDLGGEHRHSAWGNG